MVVAHSRLGPAGAHAKPQLFQIGLPRGRRIELIRRSTWHTSEMRAALTRGRLIKYSSRRAEGFLLPASGAYSCVVLKLLDVGGMFGGRHWL